VVSVDTDRALRRAEPWVEALRAARETAQNTAAMVAAATAAMVAAATAAIRNGSVCKRCSSNGTRGPHVTAESKQT
jgi:hypothetical protein